MSSLGAKFGPPDRSLKTLNKVSQPEEAPQNSSFFDEAANRAAVLRLSTKELSRTGNASKHSRSHITQRPYFLCADTLFKETFCLYISRITYGRIVEQLLVGHIIVSLTDLFNIKHNNNNGAKSMENTSCVTWKSSRNYGKLEVTAGLLHQQF